MDVYSHVVPALQENAAQRFDQLILLESVEESDVGKTDGKEGEFECEPQRTRTSNLLIKSQLLYQLS